MPASTLTAASRPLPARTRLLPEGLEMLSQSGITSLTAAAGYTLSVPHGSAEGVRAVRLPLQGTSGCHARHITPT
eukprot:11070976-Lingulodinium_polyedra.AAC.1